MTEREATGRVLEYLRGLGSQYAAARELGVTQTFISMVERGARAIPNWLYEKAGVKVSINYEEIR